LEADSSLQLVEGTVAAGHGMFAEGSKADLLNEIRADHHPACPCSGTGVTEAAKPP